MICLEILFQPLKFGSNPGTLAAAWLSFALDIERDNVPRAQIVGIPAIADSDLATGRYGVAETARLLEVPCLSIRIGHRLGEGTSSVRVVGDRSRHYGSIGIVLDAVEVREVAITGNADRAVFRVKLVVAGRGPRDHLEGAVRQLIRVLKVRILSYLVLFISDERDKVRLHGLNLLRSRCLRCEQILSRVTDAVFTRLLPVWLRLAWLAGDVADHREHRR